MTNADVVVVGGGPVGAVTAARLAAGGAPVLLVGAGCPLSPVPGTHLRNLTFCRSDPGLFRELATSLLRPLTNAPISKGLPAYRSISVAGGMGAVWNCIVPRFNEEREQWNELPKDTWPRIYAAAEELLGANASFGTGSARQRAIIEALVNRYGSMSSVPAPIAAHAAPSGLFQWTAPAEILDA